MGTIRRTNCYEQALACDLYDKLWNADSLKDILNYHQKLCNVCSLSPTNFADFYPKMKAKVPSWRANDLWAKIDKRASQSCYGQGRVCSEARVRALIIGAGPCGLRAAIEAQLLGAKTVVIEKRSGFARNNVLHLWPFSIADLRNLGAKVLYPKFCAGSIDHISIRRLQCILLKIALLIGVEVHCNVSFEELVPPESEDGCGWKGSLSPADHPVSHFHFDVLIGADGRRCTLPGFQRKALRAKLALAITANFIHRHTEAEARVPEISGVSYIFRQQFFQELEEAMGIALENIVYYKNETHYFVMTPTKQSLLDKGVLYQDFSDPEQLLAPENVDPEALQLFTMEAVVWATDNRLPDLQFATNSRGNPDVALFDFTTMYASENSCRAIQRKGHQLLLGVVGDALLEPFWPTGSGIGRGFLSAFDAAWMIRSWGKGIKSVCEVLAERESIHRLLAQTTHENLNKDHNQYSIDPTTRYPKINLHAVNAHQVKGLFDSDEQIPNIFLSIKESKRNRLVPENVILHWFQDQLKDAGIIVNSLLDVFISGKALIAILQRYRPNLVDYSDIDQNPREVNNQCSFEILEEQFSIPVVIDGPGSCSVSESDLPPLVQYLSQVYNVFKGEIPKVPNVNSHQAAEELEDAGNGISCPNNAALHHSLSIKQFLLAKEELKKRKAAEEEKLRQRSEFYESTMQEEGRSNQDRSTSIVNIPPVLKLTPIPASDLFSACRGGSDREKCRKPKIPADTISMIKLARSRSDVGNKLQGKGTGGREFVIPSSSSPKGCSSELAEVQQRIRKSKLNPLGDILGMKTYSTFLAKHINQNSGCLSNEESDENPLSTERRLLRPTRPRSMFQNLNDQEDESIGYYGDEDDQEDNVGHREDSNNPLYSCEKEEDTTFKNKCNFLEKSLYNSGRDIKVHIGAAWFPKGESKGGGNSSQKSSSSAVSSQGFHPLKRGSSFNVGNKMGEESFNNRVKEDEDTGEKRFNPTSVFSGKRLGEMANCHVPERRSGEKSPSPRSRNDHDSYHLHCHQRQQSGTAFPNPCFKLGRGDNKEQSQRRKKFGPNTNRTGASSVADSDLDCLLNAIDFNTIDAQDLQELLSSY